MLKSLGARQPKGLKRIAKKYLREEYLSVNNNYMI
jgi:hypothetical protein